MYKTSLKQLIVTESKKVLRKQKHILTGYVKGTQEPTERAPLGQNWNKQFEQ
jgi:hypothetical protein